MPARTDPNPAEADSFSVGEDRPLILIFEDLHWIDQSSEEVLKTFLEAVPAQVFPDLHLSP